MNTRSSLTRRLILQGAGSVALIGLGAVPALAAANDKYPEDAFKQKTDAEAIKAPSAARPRKPATRSSSMRPRSPRTARWCRLR